MSERIRLAFFEFLFCFMRNETKLTLSLYFIVDFEIFDYLLIRFHYDTRVNLFIGNKGATFYFI